jgi:hypothetical protein
MIRNTEYTDVVFELILDLLSQLIGIVLLSFQVTFLDGQECHQETCLNRYNCTLRMVHCQLMPTHLAQYGANIQVRVSLERGIFDVPFELESLLQLDKC